MLFWCIFIKEVPYKIPLTIRQTLHIMLNIKTAIILLGFVSTTVSSSTITYQNDKHIIYYQGQIKGEYANIHQSSKGDDGDEVDYYVRHLFYSLNFNWRYKFYKTWYLQGVVGFLGHNAAIKEKSYGETFRPAHNYNKPWLAGGLSVGNDTLDLTLGRFATYELDLPLFYTKGLKLSSSTTFFDNWLAIKNQIVSGYGHFDKNESNLSFKGVEFSNYIGLANKIFELDFGFAYGKFTDDLTKSMYEPEIDYYILMPDNATFTRGFLDFKYNLQLANNTQKLVLHAASQAIRFQNIHLQSKYNTFFANSLVPYGLDSQGETFEVGTNSAYSKVGMIYTPVNWLWVGMYYHFDVISHKIESTVYRMLEQWRYTELNLSVNPFVAIRAIELASKYDLELYLKAALGSYKIRTIADDFDSTDYYKHKYMGVGINLRF